MLENTKENAKNKLFETLNRWILKWVSRFLGTTVCCFTAAWYTKESYPGLATVLLIVGVLGLLATAATMIAAAIRARTIDNW